MPPKEPPKKKQRTSETGSKATSSSVAITAPKGRAKAKAKGKKDAASSAAPSVARTPATPARGGAAGGAQSGTVDKVASGTEQASKRKSGKAAVAKTLATDDAVAQGGVEEEAGGSGPIHERGCTVTSCHGVPIEQPSGVPTPEPSSVSDAKPVAAATTAVTSNVNRVVASSSSSTAPQRPANGAARSCAFLRLSTDCKPSKTISQLVYLNKDQISFGRLPNCDVQLDSERLPQMISRCHGYIMRQRPQASGGAAPSGPPDASSASNAAPDASNADEIFIIRDNKSLNGILVNGNHVGEVDVKLQTGDSIVFGRRVQPPEFEFVFEGASGPQEDPAATSMMAEELQEYLKRISELQRELDDERAQRSQEAKKKAQEMAQIENLQGHMKKLESDMQCSICQDYLVHAANIECSHTFCWDCIDRWLGSKKFACPECRTEVRREPVRSRALDALVQKTVDRSPEAQQMEYRDRVARAEQAIEKGKTMRTQLEKHVAEAAKKGKAFFHINTNWGKKDKDVFTRGIKDFYGATRAMYCGLTGLNEQWIHKATDSQLNQALHNLQLQKDWVGKEETEIRQRLVMFLKYG